MSSTRHAGKAAALSPTPMTSAEEETRYLQDSSPRIAALRIDHLEVDHICTQCGFWQSEHPWDTCIDPNFV